METSRVDCCPDSDPPVWVGSGAGTGNGCIAIGSLGVAGIASAVFVSERSVVGFFGTDSDVSLSLFDAEGFSSPSEARLPVCTGFGSAPVTELKRAEKGDVALGADPTERSDAEGAVVDFETIRTPE